VRETCQLVVGREHVAGEHVAGEHIAGEHVAGEDVAEHVRDLRADARARAREREMSMLQVLQRTCEAFDREEAEGGGESFERVTVQGVTV
jgi:hypothetical protein